MKYALISLLLLINFSIYSQNSFFNYSGIARNDDGSPLVTTSLSIEIKISSYQNGIIFSENHSTTTNKYGIFNIKIGSVRSLDEIEWTTDMKLQISIIYLNGRIEIEDNIASVPMAQHAETVTRLTDEQIELLKQDITVPFTYDDLTDAQKAEISLTFDQLTDDEKEQLRGEKGDPLIWDDLTDEQKLELQGEKGDPLKWEDLTTKQKEELIGQSEFTQEELAELDNIISREQNSLSAGIGGKICGDSVVLNADPLKENQIGRWTVIDYNGSMGNGSFSTIAQPSSIFYFQNSGNYQVEGWSIVNLEWNTTDTLNYKTETAFVQYKFYNLSVLDSFFLVDNNNVSVFYEKFRSNAIFLYGKKNNWKLISGKYGRFENALQNTTDILMISGSQHPKKFGFVGFPNETYIFEYTHIYGCNNIIKTFEITFESYNFYDFNNNPISIETCLDSIQLTADVDYPGKWTVLNDVKHINILNVNDPNTILYKTESEYTIAWLININNRYIPYKTYNISFKNPLKTFNIIKKDIFVNNYPITFNDNIHPEYTFIDSIYAEFIYIDNSKKKTEIFREPDTYYVNLIKGKNGQVEMTGEDRYLNFLNGMVAENYEIEIRYLDSTCDQQEFIDTLRINSIFVADIKYNIIPSSNYAFIIGNDPTNSTGYWEILSGINGKIENTSSPSTKLFGTKGETYMLRWTIFKEGQTASIEKKIVL